ncbi:MAG: aldolase/citrate lyase family protein [Clostridiaceae bacterium]|nr:aldolase/citrate lyase family protein [Clostridiaceae bacterium]
MPALEDLKGKLERCEVVIGSTFMFINNLYTPKTLKAAGLDFMLFDCEHGNFMPELAVDMLQMCRACDLPTIVRVQDCEYHCISKCIDVGADGVLIPRTETLEQVKLAIDSIRFAPKGRKGAGGLGLLRPGEDAEAFNRNRLLTIQIESPKGVQNLDAMLSTYGEEIAGILIGPCDLSIMSGTPLDTSSDIVQSQIRQVVDTAQKYRKSVGIFMGKQEIRKNLEMGMNFLWCESDMSLMAIGAREIVREAHVSRV